MLLRSIVALVHLLRCRRWGVGVAALVHLLRPRQWGVARNRPRILMPVSEGLLT